MKKIKHKRYIKERLVFHSIRISYQEEKIFLEQIYKIYLFYKENC